MPPGVVNLVHGYGEKVGDPIVRHPDVPVITFTGSRETGVARHEGRAPTLKHVQLEMGGKNAIIVMDDADLDLAVEGIVWWAFGTSGQRCTAASRVVVQRAVYDELRTRLVGAPEGCASARLGPTIDVGPVINRERAREDPRVHRDRQRRGREAAHRRRGRHRGRARQGLLLPADGLRRRRRRDADRAGGDLRADDRADPGRLASTRRSRSRTAIALRAVVSIFTRDVNKAFRAMRDLADRDHLHQRRHDRRGGAPPVRRHEGHRQRPPRGRAGRARRLHRVEVDLRRLLAASCSARRSTTSSNRRRDAAQAVNLAEKLASFDEHFKPEDRRLLRRHKSRSARRAASSCGTRIPRPTTSSSCSRGG